MRRDAFLKSLAALAAAGTLPLPARAAGSLKMMIPANPGGGWDATGRTLGRAAAILGNNVTVGGSGCSEFAEHIESGKMRPIAVTSQKRLPGIAIPTMKEQGYDVILGNWRGVYGAPGIGADDRAALTSSVLAATKTKAWTDALAKNGWTPAVLAGKGFEDFVEYEFSSLRAIMYLSGMV